jgi:sugar phosphate isomerase/epimerase
MKGTVMMLDKFGRRAFLAKTGAWGAGAALATSMGAETQDKPAKPKADKSDKGLAGKQKIKLSTPSAEKIGWQLACQLYTFRDRSFYEAIDVIASLGIRNVEPAYFLPLSKEKPDVQTNESLSADLRRELKQRLADHGMKMINYYAPINADTSVFRKIFDFAREMGVETLVAEPPAEVFGALDELCKEYKINLAVHNHPESPESKYWRPENVLKVCEGTSKRIGGCPDTGHYVRSGLDAVECLKKLKGRIVSIHLKDAAELGKRDSRDVPLGEGKANYTAVLKELYAQKFRGVMTIEYEHQSPQLVEDVAKCVKFVEDFAKSLKG